MESAREDVMDDLSNYVREVALQGEVDLGWRQISPLVEEARKTIDPRGFIDKAVERISSGQRVKTVRLEEVLGIFRKGERNGSHAGKLSRFVIELFGEELHATLFARYLQEQTGTEYKVLYEQPKSADGSHKKWLDCYVGPVESPLGGDPALRRIFACEVKSWNDNGLHSWSPGNKKGVDRIDFYSSWLHQQLPENTRLAKLRERYAPPTKGHFASDLELSNALLIYHPQSVLLDGRDAPQGDETRSGFWTNALDVPLFVFSGENYILHLEREGVRTLDIKSEALGIKLDRVNGLFLS